MPVKKGNKVASKVKETRATAAAMAAADVVAQAVLSSLEPRLNAIQDQIKESTDNLESRLNAVDTRLNTLHSDRTSLATTTTANKASIVTLTSNVASHKTSIDDHEERLKKLEAKLADSEDRNRRCNLRIVGLKEGVEGSNTVQYLNKALLVWFPSLQTEKLEVMRAHRIYDSREQDRDRPRPRTLIFSSLRCTTREAILRAARKEPPSVDGRQLRFYPDYSAHTLQCRRAFSQALNLAKEKGLETFLCYPASLKVKVGSDMHEFQDAEKAEEFLNELG